MSITWNLTFDASWATTGSGGNFGGDTNAVQGTLTAAQQLAAANQIVNQVLAELGSYIDATCTMNIQVGWGTCFGVPLTGGVIASSQIPTQTLASYEDMRNRLIRIKPNAVNKIAFPGIPAANPYGTGSVQGVEGQMSTWTNTNMSGTAAAGFVTTTGTWDYALTQTCGAGLYHLLSVARHEISQALGRAIISATPTPLGLFIFSSAGVLAPLSSWGAAAGSYFSADVGATSIGTEQTSASWDKGDFDASGSVYCSLFSTGVVPTWGANEWKQLALVYPITPLLSSMIGVPSQQIQGWKWR